MYCNLMFQELGAREPSDDDVSRWEKCEGECAKWSKKNVTSACSFHMIFLIKLPDTCKRRTSSSVNFYRKLEQDDSKTPRITWRRSKKEDFGKPSPISNPMSCLLSAKLSSCKDKSDIWIERQDLKAWLAKLTPDSSSCSLLIVLTWTLADAPEGCSLSTSTQVTLLFFQVVFPNELFCIDSLILYYEVVYQEKFFRTNFLPSFLLSRISRRHSQSLILIFFPDFQSRLLERKATWPG